MVNDIYAITEVMIYKVNRTLDTLVVLLSLGIRIPTMVDDSISIVTTEGEQPASQ